MQRGTHTGPLPVERTWREFAREDRRIDRRKIGIFEQPILAKALRLDLVVGLALQLHGWSGRAGRLAAAVPRAPSGLDAPTSAAAADVVPRRAEAVVKLAASAEVPEVSEVAEIISAAAAAVGRVLRDGGGASWAVNNGASRLHRFLVSSLLRCRLFSLCVNFGSDEAREAAGTRDVGTGTTLVRSSLQFALLRSSRSCSYSGSIY